MAFRGWGLKRIDFFSFFVADYQCRLFFLFFGGVVEEHSCLLRGGPGFENAWHGTRKSMSLFF